MRPVIEKKKFRVIHIIYIILILICVFAIGVGVYMQYFKDEKLGVIFGISAEENDEEIAELKKDFLNIFTNDINVLEENQEAIIKLKDDADLIVMAYSNKDEKENYSIDVKMPYFNINSENAKRINQEIKSIYKEKTESILKYTGTEKKVYNVKYKAYLQNEVLSLIILSELKEGNDSHQRIVIQAYTYNLKENKIMNINELINRRNLDTKNANQRIKDEVNASQEQNIKLKELGYNVNVRDVKDDKYKIENAEVFFIGEKGYLYVVYPYGNTEFTSEMDVIIFK